ncbi:MAG TPA: hypothetical protein VFR70_03090 [Flavobacterium sp.]|nr:hypothetical protein [Flavobacterium sp.]
MEEIKKQLNHLPDNRRKSYEYRLSKMSEAESQQLEALVVRMVKEGATNPLSWAFSQWDEGIPQYERFMILKNLYQYADDVAGSVDSANDFDPGFASAWQEICKAVGEEKLRKFLTSYGRGLFQSMLDILDEGNPDHESDDSWQLMQYNRTTEATGRPISGLHEDFIDFDQQLKLPETD